MSGPDREADDVLLAVERLGHTSRMFSDVERHEVAVLAAGVLRLLDLRCENLLRAASAGDNPVLQAYMSDGWSTEISKSRSVRVIKRQRRASEFHCHVRRGNFEMSHDAPKEVSRART